MAVGCLFGMTLQNLGVTIDLPRDASGKNTNLHLPLRILKKKRYKEKNRLSSIVTTDDSIDKQYNQMTKVSSYIKTMTFALAC